MLSEEVKGMAAAIGAYYLQKNNGDYVATEKEITSMRISAIAVDSTLPHSKVVSITTERPGLLIGKRGTNIDALEKFLGHKVKVIEDRDPLYNYLIPDNGWID
jgi:ribosomal protein S3